MFLFLITFKEVCFHLRSFAFQAPVVMRFQNYKSLSAYLLTVYIMRILFEFHLVRTVCEHLQIYSDSNSVCIRASISIIIQSTLVISKSKGPSKNFEISVLRHIRCVVLRKKQF